MTTVIDHDSSQDDSNPVCVKNHETIEDHLDVGESLSFIKEGLATIEYVNVNPDDVFYNPAQVFNRDLSLLVIRAFADVLWNEKQEKLKKSQNIQIECHDSSIDLSTNDIVLNKKTLNILEPLAATGLRSIRYALELEEIVQLIVSGDLDMKAVHCIEHNRLYNKISSNILYPVCSDANQLMHLSHYYGVSICKDLSNSSLTPNKLTDSLISTIPLMLPVTSRPCAQSFNVIDLDPYGSIASFLDAAVQSIEEGGLLCLTSTDMPILCGNNPEVSFYKYGGTAIKGRYMHELSLRLLIHAVSTAASRYKRVVQPLLCCSIDFYVRCFVRIYTSPIGCKRLASKTSLLFQCTACDSFSTVPLGICQPTNNSCRYKPPHLLHNNQVSSPCAQCHNENIWIGGPLFNGPLYDPSFIDKCITLCKQSSEGNVLPSLTMQPKINGLLTAMKEELLDVPFYYHLPSLFSRIKTETMKLTQFKSALLNLDYKVSHFHREPQSIKTNAPNQVIFDIMREWAKIHPPKTKEKYIILEQPILTQNICFDLHPAAMTQTPNVPKWLPNPTPYWGPKQRAGTSKKHIRSTPTHSNDTSKRHKLNN